MQEPTQFHWVVALIVGLLLFALVASLFAAIVWKRMRGDDWEPRPRSRPRSTRCSPTRSTTCARSRTLAAP